MYPDDIVLDNDLYDGDDGEIDRAEKAHAQVAVLSLRKIGNVQSSPKESFPKESFGLDKLNDQFSS